MSRLSSGAFWHPRLWGGCRLLVRRQTRRLAPFPLLLLLGAGARAHDIPGELLLRAYLKPEGETLHFVVRVPLALLQGIGFPNAARAFVGELGDSLTGPRRRSRAS